MNANCSHIDALLMDGSRAALTAAAEHAVDCGPCMETLTTWNDISETAASMRVTWQDDLLWPRIARALEKERSVATAPSRFSPRHGARWIAAAAVLVAVGIGGTAWYAERASNREFDEVILRASAVEEVARAEQIHLAAIRQLERVADTAIERGPSPLMVSYKEKLILLDDAIAECEANIAQNRHNAHLRSQLLSMYTQKQQTLREIVREGNHVTPQ
jgi:hypothetical protein